MVSLDVTRTPLLAGSDPFEQFPKTGETSISRGLVERIYSGKVASALGAIFAALVPATTTQATPQPQLSFIPRTAWEHIPTSFPSFEGSGVIRALVD